MIKSEELEPAKIPVKCVVCNGWGTVNYGKKTCHACEGKGYILVEAKERDERRPD